MGADHARRGGHQRTSRLRLLRSLGHSLRSGGSSAAEAILVPRFRGNWLGGWSQSGRTRELHYLDPSVLPTTSAFQLFGWLLQGVYEAGASGWERRMQRKSARLFVAGHRGRVRR